MTLPIACDLCTGAVGDRVVALQVSEGRLVQAAVDAVQMRHRAGGMRDFRLCEACARYLEGGMQYLVAQRGRPARA
jgi:hypothetical protein